MTRSVSFRETQTGNRNCCMHRGCGCRKSPAPPPHNTDPMHAPWGPHPTQCLPGAPPSSCSSSSPSAFAGVGGDWLGAWRAGADVLSRGSNCSWASSSEGGSLFTACDTVCFRHLISLQDERSDSLLKKAFRHLIRKAIRASSGRHRDVIRASLERFVEEGVSPPECSVIGIAERVVRCAVGERGEDTVLLTGIEPSGL